jgi:cellulose synthase/poly-beta-1,6-N-acetylglucosamine synthase-like glycosyltransferase
LDFSGIVLVASLVITSAFFVYGFNIYYMLKLSKEYRRPSCKLGRKPEIAIHLPIFNEWYVGSRLLAACTDAAEHYGKELVHVSVLDDSDDETTQMMERCATLYRAKGFDVDIKHREDRSGFKAGALDSALSETKAEFIVVFDADFVPKSDFLDRAASYITSDDRIGVVQFKWSYTNREYNWITRSVSIGMDAHFLIEQPARCAGGLFLNFNGSAGIIRASALRESGGWQADTLAEDLDVSYRMQMLNYRIQYVVDDVPCEVPPTVASFKRQQGRWARGSLQVAKKHLPRIVAAEDIKLKKKFGAFVHLTYYLVHPLMYISFILAVIAGVYNIDTIKVALPTASDVFPTGQANAVQFFLAAPLWLVFALSIVLCTAAAWVYYVTAMKRQNMGILRNLSSLVALGFLGYGASVSNTIEASKAFFLRNCGVFKRTPKYAIVGSYGSWRDKKYQVPLDFTSAVEAGSIFLAAVAIARTIYFGNFGLLIILGVYGASFTVIFFGSLLHSGGESSIVGAVDPLT